ncbi:MAG: trypsin-like peptidase domain-containing protein [Clostridia bacterium]|nr:trypsin-like peptidase domain-containing protein [Clostridia bacterium]
MNENQRIDPTPEEPGNLSQSGSPNPENPPMTDVPAPDTSNVTIPEGSTDKPHEDTQEPPVVEATPAEEPAPVYRWTYADQVAHDRAEGNAKNRKGILIYALVMTGVFLVSFGLLIAVLLVGNGNSYSGGIIRPGISNSAEDDEAVEGVEQAKHSVVVIEVKTATGGGTGTGIIMTADGYIATNHHVIEGATKIKVTFYDGSVMYAEMIGSSEMDDLGVIKVDATGLPAATFANSDECYVGQTVYAIGTPAGPDFGWTTTKGIISYKNREVKMYDEDYVTMKTKLRLLQMDDNVNPGNSGGPLVNTKGEVVGVVSMKLADGYEGIGFAIPSDGAVEILEAIMEHGNADNINSSLSHKRPMLGITGVYVDGGAYYLPTTDGVQMIPEEELGDYNVSDLLHPAVSGIYVMGFAEGMDAAEKMAVGDIITAAQGEELESMNHLMSIINEYYAGDTVTLTVYRGSVYTPVDIVLSAKPDQ